MYQIAKRALDIAVAGTITLLLLPLLAPIALALRFTGEGEIFLQAAALGVQEPAHPIYKFATMLKDSPNMPGGEITLQNDPRLLPLGGFLRKTKINEFPQLLNILKGDMGLVGPRPLMPVSFEMYSPEVQAIVYESRPGLTGIGSLVFRDEERIVTEAKAAGDDPRRFYREAIYPYKGALESWYYRNRGFWTDTRIIALTAWQTASPKSQVVRQVFTDLPVPDEALQAYWSGTKTH